MRWHNSEAQANPGTIVSPLYGDIAYDGISLRTEMTAMLYGTGGSPPKGHWIVLRHFDRTSKSDYYNEFSREGIGGPTFKYNDILLRSRRVPYPRTDSTEYAKVGNILHDQYIYYFEYDIVLSTGDQIYELELDDHTYQPTEYDFAEKYDIKRVHPYRLEHGNVVYKMAMCQYNNITY